MVDGRIEIITGRERRRRWSVAEQLRLVDAPDQPGPALPEAADPDGARSAPLPSRPAPIEVVLPDGSRVRVGQDARAALLCAVLGALRG